MIPSHGRRIGQRLRQERLALNWSQERLAAEIGATSMTVRRWEHDEVLPQARFREQLCRLFRCSAEDLFGLSINRQNETSDQMLFWQIPYPHNPFFTGRTEILQQLYDRLHQQQSTATPQFWAISGLGGIGKTQIALEYAYYYRHLYQYIFWVSAATYEAMLASFLTIAELLHLPELKTPDHSRVISALKSWLAAHQGWLLILDNVEELMLVRDFLPQSGSGYVLLTTRTPALGSLAHRIEIDEMGITEATLFLLRRARLLAPDATLEQVCEQNLAAAETVAIEMQFLPLALDQAGAYIEEVGCSLEAYLELYRARRRELLQRRGHVPSDHPESVSTTWSLSFQKIELACPAAAELLRLCAFLEPDAIPEELFRGASACLGPVLQPISADAFLLNRAIEELRKFSLLQRDAEANGLRIHRLVQAVLKDGMEREEQQVWAERVVQITNGVFPQAASPDALLLCRRFLSQAQMCSRWVEEFSFVSTEAASLLFRTATYLQNVALYEQAESLFQRAALIREHAANQERSQMAHSLKGLAISYHRQGKYEQAEPLYLRVIQIREQALGPEHRDIADALFGLANLYREQGKYEQAELLLQRALQIQEKTPAPDEANLAQALSGLGNVYLEQGKYEQAEPLYQRALHIREAIFGSEHPDVANLLNQLAHLYCQQGKYEQAEPLYQRALHIWEQALGPEHPHLTYALIGLANLYQLQGKETPTEALYQRALSILERALGPEHPNVAHPLNNLAELYQSQRKYEQAEPLYQRALHIWEQALGPEHPYVSHPLNNLARLQQKQGRYEQAESLYQRALHIRERTLSPEHPDTAEVLHGLASLYVQQGKNTQAESLYQHALRIREHVLDATHPLLAQSLHDLAVFQESQGKHEEALSFYQRALAIREQVLGPKHLDTLETRMKYLALLQSMKRQ